MEVGKIKQLIEEAIVASLEGGKEILKVYESDFAIEHKDDRSPLTQADKNAHLAIKARLDALNLPILSEEGKQMEYAERSQWDYFWMVDPLDGTKEFIKRNGEFTVNIALIHEGRPIAGVIYVPVKKVLYFAIEGEGAWKVEDITDAQGNFDNLAAAGSTLPQSNGREKFTIVASRSHMSPETEAFVKELEAEHGAVDIASMGSSLKICLVAEGAADIYPRFAPTMEWDTAAGHAIVLGAGKTILDHSTGEAMRYNKENLLNNWFIVK